MGIDGFSMANLGLNRNRSSQQLANEADNVARQGTENDIVDMDGVSRKQKVGKKDEDAAFNGHMVLIKDEEQPPQEQEEEKEKNSKKKPQKGKIPEDEISKFNFHFNKEGMIEICEGDEVISVISPEDAAKALKNLSEFSGAIINKKI